MNEKSLKAMFSSKSSEYSTPQDLFDSLDEEFGPFTLDPCATKENAKCDQYYTKDVDGLSMPWFGRVFMNPPYGREIRNWVMKAYLETRVFGNAELVVCLLPSRTDTAWWHDYVVNADEVRFIRGRIRFNGNPAPFPSAIVVFRRKENV